MRRILLAAVLPLAGCALQGPALGPAVEPPGRPRPRVDPAVIEPMPSPEKPPAQAPVLPDVLYLPSTYRVVFLDGHAALVREAGPVGAPAQTPPPRFTATDPAPLDPSLQPALLSQELQREIAANRESSARMDNALGAVMSRSRELAEQALRLEAEERRFAQRLAESEAKARERGQAPPSASTSAGGPPADP